MDQLFYRERDTLRDYVPFYSRKETLLGLETERHQVAGEGMHRGFGAFDDDDPRYQGPPQYEYTHYITVAGYRFTSHVPYGMTNQFEIVTHLANAFLNYPKNETEHEAAWRFLKQNATNLNNSKRYWMAVDHLAEIEKEKEKLRKLQETIRRAELVAALKAWEVKQNRTVSHDERLVVWTELTGLQSFEWPDDL